LRWCRKIILIGIEKEINEREMEVIWKGKRGGNEG
jgi:hypothetical protein